MESSPGVKRKDRIFAVLGKILKIVVPLAVSAGLVVWLFHKVDIHQIMGIIHRGIDYRFIVAMMVLTILSHVIRGIRWGIQLRAVGIPRIPVVAESVSILGAYALNLLFPYLGEAWRCVYIYRREGCKLSTVVGTDIGDRASDAIMILLLILLALVVARGAMDRFMDHYAIGRTLTGLAHNGMLWLWIAVGLAVVAFVVWYFRKTKAVQGILTSAERVWKGFSVLFHMKGTGMYILLTFGIWICYFLQTYLCFFAFPFMRPLITDPGMCFGLLPGLVVFVFGSCSMAVPSNGGLGAWNIAVMFALALYGVSAVDGAAFSLVVWSFQTLAQIGGGIFSAGYIMYEHRRGRLRPAPVSPK